MKKSLILIFISLFGVGLSGQELEKAPKQYSFELGYRYMISNDLVPDGGAHGYGFLIDYAWQLSGFTAEKRAVYLSVPLGYSIIPGAESGPGQRMLHYGWTVRHMLVKEGKVQPFLGYALLLNQVSVEDEAGQLFGHQTRFAAGSNFTTDGILTPYISVEYSMARHPQLGIEESTWIHFLELKAGIRIK